MHVLPFWEKMFSQKFLHLQKFLPENAQIWVFLVLAQTKISGRNFCSMSEISAKKNISILYLYHMSDLEKSIHNSKIHIVLNFFFIFQKVVSVFQNFRVFLNFRILVIFYQITRKYAYFGVYMRLKSFLYLFLYHKKPIWVLFFGLNKPQKFFENFHFLKIGPNFYPFFEKFQIWSNFQKMKIFKKFLWFIWTKK